MTTKLFDWHCGPQIWRYVFFLLFVHFAAYFVCFAFPR